MFVCQIEQSILWLEPETAVRNVVHSATITRTVSLPFVPFHNLNFGELSESSFHYCVSKIQCVVWNNPLQKFFVELEPRRYAFESSAECLLMLQEDIKLGYQLQVNAEIFDAKSAAVKSLRSIKDEKEMIAVAWGGKWITIEKIDHELMNSLSADAIVIKELPYDGTPA